MDDNRDYFFSKLKDKFEEAEHPFREEDWEKLEPRLRESRNRYWFIRLLSLILLLSALGLLGGNYFRLFPKEASLKNHFETVNKSGKKHHFDAGSKGVSVPRSDKNNQNEIGLDSNSLNENKKARINPLVEGPGSVRDAPKFGLKDKYSIENSPKKDFKTKGGYSNTSKHSKKPGNDSRLSDKFPGFLSNYPSKDGLNRRKQFLEIHNESEINSDRNLYKVSNTSYRIPGLDTLIARSYGISLPTYAVFPWKQDIDIRIKPKKSKRDREISKPDNYWFISVLAAPDFNEVGSINSTQVAFNLGAQLGYNLTDRWKVSAGLIYGPKLYQASDQAYANSSFPSYWTHLQSIDANCKVFDIPLEIGYSFYKKNRSQFYLNAGVSTYFMHEETYTINFVPGSTVNPSSGLPVNSYTYSIYNRNKNILSVADFVLEYHYRLNNRASFGISPYLKLPFAGVGQGKLELISFGTSVSLHYGFGKTH